MCPDDSTVSLMNLSVKPFIIASMAMNIVTEMVTPAMQTSDWRLWEKKYRVEMNQRIAILLLPQAPVAGLHRRRHHFRHDVHRHGGDDERLHRQVHQRDGRIVRAHHR